MSKTDHYLIRQKVCQRISGIPENWHFNSRFVVKTTKAPVFVFITEIIWWTFWRNTLRSLLNELACLTPKLGVKRAISFNRDLSIKRKYGIFILMVSWKFSPVNYDVESRRVQSFDSSIRIKYECALNPTNPYFGFCSIQDLHNVW